MERGARRSSMESVEALALRIGGKIADHAGEGRGA